MKRDNKATQTHICIYCKNPYTVKANMKNKGCPDPKCKLERLKALCEKGENRKIMKRRGTNYKKVGRK